MQRRSHGGRPLAIATLIANCADPNAPMWTHATENPPSPAGFLRVAGAGVLEVLFALGLLDGEASFLGVPHHPAGHAALHRTICVRCRYGAAASGPRAHRRRTPTA